MPLNRRAFLTRILGAAVATPAMDLIVKAAAPKPLAAPVYLKWSDATMVSGVTCATNMFAYTVRDPVYLTWEPVLLPPVKLEGVLDTDWP